MRLSFCIPVVNFGAFLPETIESIRSQMNDAIEIVVLDGGSSDDTPEVMSRICARDPRARYVRRERAGGIDADLRVCIDAARGEYCWLLSGDDVLRPGAIDYVLRSLGRETDVHLLTHSNCTAALELIGVHPVARVAAPWRFDLGTQGDRRTWLAKARNTEALFSFMSTLVVRRDTWYSVSPRTDFDGSCWAHAATLLEIAKHRLRVVYHPNPLVDRRGENDSFRQRGIVRRLGIAVDGFDRIANEFARDAFESRQIRRLVRADLPIRFFIGAKGACRRNPEKESKVELDRLARLCYRGDGIANTVKWLLYRMFPSALVPAARKGLVFLRSAFGRS